MLYHRSEYSLIYGCIKIGRPYRPSDLIVHAVIGIWKVAHGVATWSAEHL